MAEETAQEERNERRETVMENSQVRVLIRRFIANYTGSMQAQIQELVKWQLPYLRSSAAVRQLEDI
jgi:hypothetical protein